MWAGAVVALVAVLVALVVVAQRRRSRTNLIVLNLTFSRGLERRAVEDFVGSIVGLRPPWWRWWLDCPTVRFELSAASTGVTYRLVVAERYQSRIETALRAHLPTVRFTSDTYTGIAMPMATAAEYRLTNQHRQLRVTDDSFLRELVGSLILRDADHRAVVQWLVAPTRPLAVPRKSEDVGRPTRHSGLATDADVAAAKEKMRYPVLGAVLRIGVTTGAVGSDRALLRHVESALHGTGAPGVHLRRRLLPKSLVARRLNKGAVPRAEWSTFNAHELGALLGIPHGSIASPALNLRGSRPLALSPAVPMTGTVIGDGFSQGSDRPAAVADGGRFMHTAIVGTTGAGKSTLDTAMAISDIEHGHGVLIVDPKGDLLDGVLERVPDRHRERVIVVDPADAAQPVGLNPLRPQGIDPELAAEHLISIAHRLWAQSWGVRSQDLIYAAVRTLVADPDATLVDILPILTDPAFRRPLVAKSSDVVLEGFWRQMGSLSDAEMNQWVAPVANKLRQVLARPGLRRILGQAHPAVDIGDHLDHGGVVLVNLNSGLIGDDAAALFGAIVLGQLWNVVQRRASRPVPDRHPLFVHLDEVGRYASMPVPLDEMLAQARSYRVGISLAFQHLSQLTPELRQAVLSNTRTKVVFNVAAADARVLAAEFGNGLTVDDLTGLDAYQVVAQIYAAGRTQPAATLTTRPLGEPLTDASSLRQESRDRWGADGIEVEEEIRRRFTNASGLRSSDPSTPAGRKRRSS